MARITPELLEAISLAKAQSELFDFGRANRCTLKRRSLLSMFGKALLFLAVLEVARNVARVHVKMLTDRAEDSGEGQLPIRLLDSTLVLDDGLSRQAAGSREPYRRQLEEAQVEEGRSALEVSRGRKMLAHEESAGASVEVLPALPLSLR